jgi:hypothetical protein
MRAYFLALSLVLGLSVAAQVIVVPNADFEEIFLPGSDAITGVLVDGGNSWTQGVGPNCPIDVGGYSFLDGTTGAVADIPGWVGYDKDGWVALGGTYGRDQTTGNLQGSIQANGVNGSYCYLANGSDWGNAAGGLIVSAAPLCNVEDGVYTLSMVARGGAAPVVLKLLADGIELTPTSSVDPVFSDGFQEFSRTYDSAGLLGFLGKPLTICLGVGRGASGTQSQLDSVSLIKDKETVTLPITGLGCTTACGSDVTLSWTNGAADYSSIEVREDAEVRATLAGDLIQTVLTAQPDGDHTYTVVAVKDGVASTGVACSVTVAAVPVVTLSVTNFDFEAIYLPGSDTITGTLSAGGWTKGVGLCCPIDEGLYNFSDGTSGTVAVIPGWVGYDRDGWIAWGGTYGRDQTTGNLQGSIQANGVDGSYCYLANGGGWGNSAGGLIVSDASLGNGEDGIYTLSMVARGDAAPVELNLLAAGVVVTPTSSVDPILSGDFQEFSRTYDSASLVGFLGKPLTICLGVARGASGGQTQFDNVSLIKDKETVTPPVTGLGCTASGSDVTLSWTNGADDYSSIEVREGAEVRATLAGNAVGAVLTAQPGAHTYTVSAVKGLVASTGVACSVTVSEMTISVFMGNVNGDNSVNIADAVALLGYLFAQKGAPGCAKAADANDDDSLNIADAVSILGYLFSGQSMKAPDGSVVSAGGGNPAACKPYAANGTDNGGKPNFPAEVSRLPACATPCR